VANQVDPAEMRSRFPCAEYHFGAQIRQTKRRAQTEQSHWLRRRQPYWCSNVNKAKATTATGAQVSSKGTCVFYIICEFFDLEPYRTIDVGSPADDLLAVCGSRRRRLLSNPPSRHDRGVKTRSSVSKVQSLQTGLLSRELNYHVLTQLVLPFLTWPHRTHNRPFLILKSPRELWWVLGRASFVFITSEPESLPDNYLGADRLCLIAFETAADRVSTLCHVGPANSRNFGYLLIF
jgi:hypothetical protein